MSLTLSVTLSAYFFFFVINSNLCQKCDRLDTDVLILGGGMSGVAAANRFDENNINFILIEAKQKLGGRIKQLELRPGVFVPEGASFIQGVDRSVPMNMQKHPLVRLAYECDPDDIIETRSVSNIDMTNLTDLITVYDTNGRNINDEFRDSRLRFTTAESDAFNLNREPPLPDISVREAFNRVDWDIRSTLDNFTEWEGFDFCIGESPDPSSFYGTTDIDTYRKYLAVERDDFIEVHTDLFVTDQRGYLHLVNCLAKEFMNDESKVKLNTTVTKIWNNEDDCICVDISNGSKNDTLCGKYGILTFSIGVVQREEFQMKVLDTPFSTGKRDAMSILVMAHYLKIFVVFDRIFWDLDMFYIGHVHEHRGYYPIILTMKGFPQDLNTLMFVVTGEQALTIVEQSESTTQQQIMEVLQSIYSDVSTIQRIYVEKFSTDPMFLGAFSNYHTGYTEDKYYEIALSEYRLYFAGEAYSKDHNGFVHGAYTTGQEAAENLTRELNFNTLQTVPKSSNPNSGPTNGCSPTIRINILELLLLGLLLL